MISIRMLHAADAEAYLRVRLAALREMPSAFGSSYEEECGMTVEEVAQRLPPAADHSYWCLGAFSDQRELVGILAFARAAKHKQRHWASIYGAYVVPAFRRQGVARDMLDAAIHAARNLDGMRFLQLWVGVDNHAAQALYRQAGFKVHGDLPEALQVDGRFYDESLCILKLA